MVGTVGGVGLILITERIGAAFGKPFSIPLSQTGMGVAIVFSVVVGVVFGWYPARRAAKLDPIAAIAGV